MTQSGATTPDGPLADVRVLDFTWMLAGPYCTMLLADLGADVIKVEPPGGDPTREIGPFAPGDNLRAYGGYFQSVNRNKRSIELDLKSEEGKATAERLAERADIVVENFRSGVLDRLGFGYERLREINPKLVYASLSGFGNPRTGASPHSERRAVDVTAQALGGLMGITGPGPGQPMKTGPGVGDIFPGTLCTVGILAALHHARETGAGQYVDVALYDGVLALCERIVYQHSYEGTVPVPQGNSHPIFVPFDLFPARDGHVTISATEPKEWSEFCRAIDRADLLEDERFQTRAGRTAHADEIRTIASEWTARHTRREIVDALGDVVPTGEVQTVEDIWLDPHTRSREMLVEVEQPGVAAPMTIAGSPIKLTNTPSLVRRRAPTLGEHKDEILAEIADPTDVGSPGATSKPKGN